MFSLKTEKSKTPFLLPTDCGMAGLYLIWLQIGVRGEGRAPSLRLLDQRER